MPKSSDNPAEKNGRRRLMATARRLFTSRGTANVGINDVTESAGVARMTLYNNFSSKDELIVAVYKELIETTLASLEGLNVRGKSEEDRVLAIFDHFEQLACEGDNRGCPFIHASLQAAESKGPIYAMVQSYKRALRDHVLGLLNEARENRADLADQLLILLDGTVIEAYLLGTTQPAKSARRAAATLLRSEA